MDNSTTTNSIAHDDYRIVQVNVNEFKIQRRFTILVTVEKSDGIISFIKRFFRGESDFERKETEEWIYLSWNGAWNQYWNSHFLFETVEEVIAKIEEIKKLEEIAKQFPRIIEYGNK